ncbi:MAG: hypothetical protein ACRELG_24850, partial [Gemmataceae bacterium]
MSNGLLFGLTTGLFGGLFWALITSVAPDESLVASRWIVLSGGFLFWFLVGFLIGVFNAPTVTRISVPSNRVERSLIQRMLVAIAWFIYRLIVGYFVAVIATSVFSLIGLPLWFAAGYFFFGLDKAHSDSPVVHTLLSGMMASMVCGFSGGVFGALIGTRLSASYRPAIGPRAVRSSLLAFLFGIPFGTALGWLPHKETPFYY